MIPFPTEKRVSGTSDSMSFPDEIKHDRRNSDIEKCKLESFIQLLSTIVLALGKLKDC